jgi:GNAT superfamily N-acetyltransferase
MKVIKKIKDKGFKKSIVIFFQLIKSRIIPGFQIALVFETLLKNKYPEIKLNEDIKIKIINNPDELKEFAERRGNWYYEHAKHLLNEGNFCFVAYVNGKIASCIWTSFNTVNISEVKYELKVEDNIVPFKDYYTLEEYRRKGLLRILYNYCINFLIDLHKYDKTQNHISYNNKISLKTHRKLAPDTVLVMKIIMIKGFGIRFHIIKNLT